MSPQQSRLEAHRQKKAWVSPRTLEVLEWSSLQEWLSDKAQTPIGKTLCQHLSPGLLTRGEAELRAEAVMEASSLKTDADLILPLSDVPELGHVLQRITRSGAISVEEFASLIRFHKVIQGLHQFLARPSLNKPCLKRSLAGLELLETWARDHFPLLDPQGQIVDSASEDLGALRSLTRDLHLRIKARLEDFLHNPKLAEIMQDTYVTIRDGRYVIPVKTNFRGRVPGIVHDVSNTESTLFIEPQEIVEWNNQLKVAEKEIEKEIERIMAEVVQSTKPSVGAFERNLEIVAVADFISAGAQLALTWGQCCVADSRSPEVSLIDLRHPLLALHRNVVPATLSFQQAFILTGPNTGGKTVLLKGLGLAFCLTWAGLPVPAKSASLAENLSAIFADIGDDQSLEQNLSTFSGHLLMLKEMIEATLPGDLVLVDEIATGTSPEEGQPLAQAFVETLLKKKVRLLVTTHYGGLKQFAMANEECRIASMAFDSATKRPTYEIILDIPGESSAFEIAEELGFPHEVTERAKSLKGEAPKDFKIAISRLEEARKNLAARNAEVELALMKAREREEKAQQKILDYEQRQRQGLSDASREILREFSALREELSQAVKKASQGDLAAGAAGLFGKLSETSDHIRSAVESKGSFDPSLLAIDDSDLQADNYVDVEGFGMGQILENPKDLNRGPKTPVSVRVGEIQMTVARSKLRKPPQDQVRSYKASRAANAAARERKMSSTVPSASMASHKGSAISGSVVCDVRGKTLDDAMRRIEGALNGLTRDEDAIITIIHGHGSERLKDGIRDYIKKVRSDLEYRPGTWPGEGGDGVTVVERNKS